MKQQLLCLVAVLFSMLIVGCGTGKPADLPNLYPCKIKIVDKNGVPIDNASVVATQPDNIWASIGLTGPNGIALLKTNGVHPGIPIGTYKIVVTKYDMTGTEEKPIETMIFDKSFADESTTPLQLTVEAKANNVTFTVF